MISFELAKKLKDAGFPQSEFPRAVTAVIVSTPEQLHTRPDPLPRSSSTSTRSAQLSAERFP
jgi:hypothetical protein